MQSRHAALRSRFQAFRAEQSRHQQQEVSEEDADDPGSDAASVEYEVLSGDEDGHEAQSTPLEDEKHQPENIVPTNSKPAQWTRPAIYYLIGFYKHLARSESLGRSGFGPIAIWTEVSKRLLQRGYTCTPEQCRTKWLLLKKLYKHISYESQIQKFDFLEAMHDYLKCPRIERLLQGMKTKSEEEPAVQRRGAKRKLVKEENEHEKFQLEVDNCDVVSEKVASTAEMEWDLIDQSKCTVVPDELVEENTTEKYNIVIERQEESPPLYEGSVQNEEQPVLSSSQSTDNTLPVTSENYLQQIKELIELQEHRRNERHNAKLEMFREYNERLLSQQEAAITLHKKLMERLIDSL